MDAGGHFLVFVGGGDGNKDVPVAWIQLQVPDTADSWIPDFVEALGGLRLNGDGVPEGLLLPDRLAKLAEGHKQLLALSAIEPPKQAAAKRDATVAYDEAITKGTPEALLAFVDEFPYDQRGVRIREIIASRAAEITAKSDEDAWGRASRADTVEAYRQYLKTFPDGAHAENAHRRIAALETVAETRTGGGSANNDTLKRIEAFIVDEHLPGRHHFADKVDYFDKGVVSKEFAIEDSEKYSRKWPFRNYELVPGTLQVSSGSDGSYRASFKYTYRVSNGTKTLTGTGYSQLTLNLTGESLFVVGVKEIVSRD